MFGTNSFHAKGRMKMRNITSPFGRLRKKKLRQKACNTIIFPYSTNRIVGLGRCRCGTPFEVKSNAQTSKERKFDWNVFMALMT